MSEPMFTREELSTVFGVLSGLGMMAMAVIETQRDHLEPQARENLDIVPILLDRLDKAMHANLEASVEMGHEEAYLAGLQTAVNDLNNTTFAAREARGLDAELVKLLDG